MSEKEIEHISDAYRILLITNILLVSITSSIYLYADPIEISIYSMMWYFIICFGGTFVIMAILYQESQYLNTIPYLKRLTKGVLVSLLISSTINIVGQRDTYVYSATEKEYSSLSSDDRLDIKWVEVDEISYKRYDDAFRDECSTVDKTSFWNPFIGERFFVRKQYYKE